MKMKLSLVASTSLLLCRAALAEPVLPHAAYYTQCLSAAIQGKSLDRDGRYLRFACYGEAAHSFFDALGQRQPDVAYTEVRDVAEFRFTERPKENTYGLDYCRRDPRVNPSWEYMCVLIDPAGGFLDR